MSVSNLKPSKIKALLQENPFLLLQTFCFTGLPFIRLTGKGLADIRKNELVEWFLDR